MTTFPFQEAKVLNIGWEKRHRYLMPKYEVKFTHNGFYTKGFKMWIQQHELDTVQSMGDKNNDVAHMFGVDFDDDFADVFDDDFLNDDA